MLVAAIYDKTMSIDVTALRSDTKAVTLMGTDVERIVRGVQDMHELWANVVTIALATWLLKAELGLACIGPIIVTFRESTQPTAEQCLYIPSVCRCNLVCCHFHGAATEAVDGSD